MFLSVDGRVFGLLLLWVDKILKKKKISLFIFKRETMPVRETERESQAGSKLSAQSPTWGSISQTPEMVT